MLACALDDRTQRAMWLGTFEPAETTLISQRLGPGDCFVDVGAHIGWFSVLAGRAIGEGGRVFAFEPFPANAARLIANLALNQLTNVTVHTVAASHVTEIAPLGTAGQDGDSGSARLGGAGRHGSAELRVSTARLDDLIPADAHPAVVKIDAEGYVQRHDGQVIGWARSPAAGTLSIRRQINARWRTVARRRVVRNGVVNLPLHGARPGTYRAIVGTETSPIWRLPRL